MFKLFILMVNYNKGFINQAKLEFRVLVLFKPDIPNLAANHQLVSFYGTWNCIEKNLVYLKYICWKKSSSNKAHPYFSFIEFLKYFFTAVRFEKVILQTYHSASKWFHSSITSILIEMLFWLCDCLCVTLISNFHLN